MDCLWIFDAFQLIRELDITGGDDRKIGYYAGLVVSHNLLSLKGSGIRSDVDVRPLTRC